MLYRKKAARPRTPARPAPESAAVLPAPAVGTEVEVPVALLAAVVAVEVREPVPAAAVDLVVPVAVPLE